MRVLGRQDNGGNSLSLAAWLCWGSGGEALPPTQTTMANLWMPLLGGAAYRSSPIINPLPYEMGDPHPFSPVLFPAPPPREQHAAASGALHQVFGKVDWKSSPGHSLKCPQQSNALCVPLTSTPHYRICFSLFLRQGSSYMVQSDLELKLFLPQPSGCWDNSKAPHMTDCLFIIYFLLLA